MSFIKLIFKPGINRDTTNYANEGGWYECDKIRFYSGYPQKLGGWVKASPSSFLGVCRQMWNWITSYQDNFVAVGTNKKVYIEAGAIFYDITPIRDPLAAPNTQYTFITPDTDDCVSTTNGSTIINITVIDHGCLVGDYVTIAGVTGTVGGIPDSEINAEHEVISVVDADNFEIEVSTVATSTVANGGGSAIKIGCQINIGPASGVLGYGWGTGGWEDDGWGLSSDEPVYSPQRDWWFDNFDNDLVMNIRAVVQQAGDIPTGGPIYYWVRGSSIPPTAELATRAVFLSSLPGAVDVPESAGQILISQNNKHLLAFGAQPYTGSSGDYDPLLIRWASLDEPQYWTPSGTTPDGRVSSAGFLRVSRGSKIVRAIPTRQETVVFTDTHLYSLQFLGTEEVFALQELSDSISIMGPRSVSAVNNVVFWMGKDKFYMYDGRTQVLPSTLREHVFKNINLQQFEQVICGINESYNEVWWFYCSANSNVVDSYVVYGYLENVWYYGSLERTAWLDKSSDGKPLATAYGTETELKGNLIALAIIRAAVSREPEESLFVNQKIGGRSIGDINNDGDVTSADAVAYAKWSANPNDPTLTAEQIDWIENYLNPYMLADPITYAAYIKTIADVSYLYKHETGVDADGDVMESYIQSSDFDLGDGEKFMLTRRIIPDVNFVSSTAESPEVNMTVRPRNWPGSNFTNDPSDTQRVIQTSINQYTNQVFVRARARQMAIKISSDDLGVFWQLGALRLDAREDGKQ